MNFANLIAFELWGNSGQQYATALAVFVGLMIVFKIFQMIILHKLKNLTERTDTDVDDFVIRLVKHIKPPFYFMVAFYLATQFLSLNEFLRKVVFGAFVIILVIQVITTAQKIIDYFIKKKILDNNDEEDKNKEAIIKLSAQLTKAALWVFGGLLILSNIGVDVTSLIAGLGIGGIAIALAVKDVLGDMFASFSIFVDKPFKVGDMVEISPEEKGKVEKIGIKTTRLRTIQGQQIIVANKVLTEATIQNYRRMEKRQTSYILGVTYETPRSKLKKIPGMIKKIIEQQKQATVVRVYLKNFGDFSINFEVVFKMEDPDIELFTRTQHKIHMETLKAFEQEGIEFAYPTQTLFVQKNEAAENR
jgi:small-conductance mechanosensitive channel